MASATHFTRLHVVFAGRGDALVVEFDEAAFPNNPLDTTRRRVLMLIDGGPLYKHPGIGLSGNSYSATYTEVTSPESAAPYYKHLNAALREIWGTEDQLVVRTILNTHPDDDHYGGLLRLLAFNKNEPQFRLGKNFLTPYWPDEKCYKRIAGALKALDCHPVHATLTSLNDTRLAVYYPDDMAHTIEFNATNQPNVGLDPAKDLDRTDAKEKNDGSILGIVRDANLQDTIFFTGDGSANRIQKVMEKRAGELHPGQDVLYEVPVYKIQHHGGWLKQHPDWYEAFNFGDQVAAELIVYSILAYAVDKHLPKGYTYSHNEVTWIGEYVHYFETSCLLPLGYTATGMYTILKDRRRQYTEQAMDVKRAVYAETTYILDNQPHDQAIQDAYNKIVADTVPPYKNPDKRQITTIQTAFMQTYPGRPWNHVYVPKRKKVGNKVEWVSWLSPWMEKFCYDPLVRDLRQLHLIGQIQKFYAGFRAQIYVVSGSAEIHGHPKVPTLMGLAHAVRRQNREAILFMTDPGMLFTENLTMATDFCGFTRGELFAGNHLKVHYLANNTFMSLDAAPGVALNGRSLGGRTEAIYNFDDDTASALIVSRLESVAQVLPPLTTKHLLSERWMLVVLGPENEWWYMRPKFSPRHNQSVPTFFKSDATTVLRGCRMFVRETPDLRSGQFSVEVSGLSTFTKIAKLQVERRDSTSQIVDWTVRVIMNNRTYQISLDEVAEKVKLATPGRPGNPPARVFFTRQRLRPWKEITKKKGSTMKGRTRPSFQMASSVAPIVPMATMQLVDDSQSESIVSSEMAALSHVDIADNNLHTFSVNGASDATGSSSTTSDSGYESSAQSTEAPSISGKAVWNSLTGHTKGDPTDEDSNDLELESELVDDDVPEDDEKDEYYTAPATDDPNADPPEAVISLRKYLEIAGLQPDKILKRSQALDAIIGKTNEISASSKTGLFAVVLDGALDLESSAVNYKKDKDTGFDFTSVSLVDPQKAASGAPMKLQLEDEEFSIATSELVLTRRDLGLEMTALIQTTDGLRVGMNTKTSLKRRHPTLRAFLHKARFPADKVDEVSIAALFHFLLGGTDRVVRLFSGAMPAALLKVKPALLMPDLDRSIVDFDASPSGDPDLRNANIATKMGSEKGSPELVIDLSIIRLKLTDVSFHISDLRSTSQRISFMAIATASLLDSQDSVKLKLRFEMANHLSEISLDTTYAKSLGDLAKLIAVDSASLGEVPVPMTKFGPKGEEQNKMLSKLDSSAICFTIHEVGKGSGKFQLASVFLSVKFDDIDWKDWLPKSLKDNSASDHSLIDQVVARVTVLDPTDKKLRRARVEVRFTINLLGPSMETDSGLRIETRQAIDARLLADPLGAPGLGGYDFRLLLKCPVGIGIGDVLQAVGLNMGTEMSRGTPIFDTLLNKVKVTEVGVGVEHSSEQTEISDWTVSLLVEDVSLVPGQFTLTRLETTVARVHEESMLCFEGRGEFLIHTLNRIFTVDFRAPQLELPGFVEIQAPKGLSLGELLGCVGVNLSNVPIIGGYMDVRLVSCGIDFGYVSSEQKKLPAPVRGEAQESKPSLRIWGIHAQFQKPTLDIAGLVFSDLVFKFVWRSKHDIFAVGKDRYDFCAQATLPKGNFGVRLSYSTRTDILGAEVLPSATKGNTIGDLLDLCVSANMAKTFKPVVGALSLQTAAITINAKKEVVQGLEIVLGATDSLELQTDTPTPVSVRSLAISYRRGKDSDAISKTEPDKDAKQEVQHVDTSTKSQQPASAKDDATRDVFVIKGVVALNGLKASVTFTYLSPAKNSVGEIKLTIDSVDEEALSLENLAKLFGLTRPSPDTPKGVSGLLTLRITNAKGVVDVVSRDAKKEDGNMTDKSRFSLSSLFIAVETRKPFQLFEEPPVSLEDLYLKVDYTRAKPEATTQSSAATANVDTQQKSAGSPFYLEALIHGSMTIGSQRLEVAYRRDSTHSPDESIFIGRWSPKTGQKLDFKDVTDRLLVKRTNEHTIEPAFDLFPERRAATPPEGEKNPEDPNPLNLPSEIPVAEAIFIFKPGSFLEVSIKGSNLWTGRFAELDVKVLQLGGYLRLVKPVAPAPASGSRDVTASKSKYEITVRLRGKMEIGDFTSAVAELDISPTPDGEGKKARRTLTSRIIRKEGSSGNIGGLAAKLSSSSSLPEHERQPEWSQLTKGTTPFTIVGEADLIIDFTAKSLFVHGHIDGRGSGVLLARPHPTNPKTTAFVFALAVDNVRTVWPQLKETVSDAFELRRVAVQVLTYQTTPKALRDEIAAALRLARGEMQPDKNRNASLQPHGLELQVAAPHTTPKHDEEEDQKLTGHLSFPAIEREQLTPSAWFLAEVILGGSGSIPSSMSSSLSLAANDGAKIESSVLLYACIDMDNDPKSPKQNSTHYKVAIHNLSLAGGIVEIIEGLGTYTPGDKSLTGSRSLKIRASVKLQHKALSSDPLLFDVTLDIVAGSTSFTAQGGSAGPSLAEPFNNGMFNVKLVKLQLSGTFTRTEMRTTKSYALSGRVQIGGSGQEEESLEAALLFEDFKPRGALLRYNANASVPVGDLTSKFLLQRGGSSTVTTWPSSHPNFRLESVTISYITPGRPFNSMDPGYHLAAAVYLFDKPFTLSMDITQARERGGVKFTAMYNKAIDLEILTLTGFFNLEDGTRENGPAVSIDATGLSGEVIEARAGVSLLGSDPPMNAKLAYVIGDKALKGTLYLPSGFLGIPGEQGIGVMYKNGRLSFSGLALADEFSDIADLREMIRDGSNAVKGGCGALVDFVFEEGVSGKFIFGLSLPHEDKAQEQNGGDENRNDGIMGKHQNLVRGKTIRLAATWRYEIRLLGQKVLTVNLHDLPVEVDPHIKGDGLIETLAKHVADIVPHLIKKIVKDSDTMTKLSLIFAIEQCSKEVIKSLLCRGAKNTRLPPCGQTHVETEANNIKDVAKKGIDIVEALELAAAAVATGFVVGELAALTVVAGPFLTALGIGLGLVAALAFLKKLKDLVSEHDPKRQKAVDDAYKAADDAKKRFDNTVERVKTKFQETMTIVKPFKFETVSDEPLKMAVKADWSDAVPALLLSTPERPQDVAWEVQFSSDPEFEAADTVTAQVKSAMSGSREDTKVWPFAPEVYCRVRGSLTISKEVEGTMRSQFFQAKWSHVAKVTRVPFLPPPKSVSFASEHEVGSITTTSTEKRIQVRVPVPDIGESAAVLFDRQIVHGEGALKVSTVDNVKLLLASQEQSPSAFALLKGTKAVRAYARNISPDNSHRNSAWAESNPVSVVIGPEPILLTAEMQGTDIKTSWTISTLDAQSTNPKPLIYIVDKDGNWGLPVSTSFSDPVSTTREILFTAPANIKTNDQITVAVCDRIVPAGGLPMFAGRGLTVDYLPGVTINSNDSYLDLQTQQLMMFVTSTFNPLPSSEVVARFTPKKGESPIEKAIVSPIQWTKNPDCPTVTSVLVVASVKPPLSSSVAVIMRDSTTKHEKGSNPWAVSVSRSRLPIPVLTAHVNAEATELTVSWVPLHDKTVAHVRVQIDAAVAENVKGPAHQSSYGTAQLGKPLTPGSKFVISARAIAGRVQGKLARLEYTVPAPDVPVGVTSHEPVLRDVSSKCGITTSSLSEHGCVVWAVSTKGSILGADVDISKPDTTNVSSIALQNATTTPAVADRQSLAHVQTCSARADLFWVDTTGAIQARRWTADATRPSNNPREFRAVEDFPFNKVGTARITGGASIAALARSSASGKHVDLWWIDAAGALLKATSTSSTSANGADEWTDADFLVWGEMGPAAGGGGLAACRSGSDVTDILWITASGRVHGVCYRDGGDDDDDDDDDNGDNGDNGDPAMGSLYRVGDGAAPGAGIAVLADIENSYTRICWIAADGSVVTACRRIGKEPVSKRWYVSLLAGPGSANIRSQIAAFKTSGAGKGEEEMRLWWIGANGDVIAARTRGIAEIRPAWSCNRLMPAATKDSECKELAAEVLGNSVQLFYLDGKGQVFNHLVGTRIVQ